MCSPSASSAILGASRLIDDFINVIDPKAILNSPVNRSNFVLHGHSRVLPSTANPRISPLSGSEGIAIRDYSKTQPQITVINASSGALETTYLTPSPTFYRFNMDGAQWQAGLGDYIYNVKHYKKIATVGEDYSFVYTQVFGLALEFCKAGGQITKRFWVPPAPRTSLRSFRPCPMTSMPSISASAAPTP
jgi:hypothetical protein